MGYFSANKHLFTTDSSEHQQMPPIICMFNYNQNYWLQQKVNEWSKIKMSKCVAIVEYTFVKQKIIQWCNKILICFLEIKVQVQQGVKAIFDMFWNCC